MKYNFENFDESKAKPTTISRNIHKRNLPNICAAAKGNARKYFQSALLAQSTIIVLTPRPNESEIEQ